MDFSPERALELATIEHEMGVKSTYFLLMHSPFYNLFEKQNFEMFCKIRELGHDLALHFDFAFYESEDKKYIEECMRWTPEWADGLPINCESGTGKTYGDCE